MPKKDASKAEFVRSLPATMPAKEVVEKAKEAGHKLSVAYVYVIRSQARTGRKKGPAAKTNTNGNAQARLLAAASELGLTRSIELLTAEKARVVRLLR
jgi:hypothetical protein